MMIILILLHGCFATGFANSRRHFHDKVYEDFTQVYPCISRSNGTHNFGCTSDYDGNIGIVHVVYTANDIKELKDVVEDDQYIVLLPQELFNRYVLTTLNATKVVNGIVVVKDDAHRPNLPFSHQDKCPNRYSGFQGESTCDDDNPWNPFGTGLMLEKWHFPIFLMDIGLANKIIKCYHRFNSPKNDPWISPRCALRMSAHMFTRVNSARCMRRNELGMDVNPIKFCDPLGDRNIYTPLYPFRRNEATERSLIIVAAPFDATSFFYDLSRGAISAATSVVTLLATAKLLFEMQAMEKAKQAEKNVLFVLFNGEAFDYIGSSRMVYDIMQQTFPTEQRPIKLQNIELFIELSQIQGNSDLYFHYLNNNQTKDTIDGFIQEFKNESEAYSLKIEELKSYRVFPPSSAQSFLSADPNFPALVVASYNRAFQNRYYHSFRDDASNAQYHYHNGKNISTRSIQAAVANISTVLAKTLYARLTNDKTEKNYTVSIAEVDELMNCYVNTLSCNLFRKMGIAQGNAPLSYYVNTDLTVNLLTTLTSYALTNFTGQRINKNITEDQCLERNNEDDGYKYVWFSGEADKYCIKSTVNSSEAVSPAFIIDGYDYSSGKYSTWTESVWRSTNLEMFVVASQRYEYLTLSLGIMTALVSFVVVRFIATDQHQQLE